MSGIVNFSLYRDALGVRRVAIRYADDAEEDRPASALEEHLLSPRSAVVEIPVGFEFTPSRAIDADALCNLVIMDVAEIPDRFSPDDFPEAMLVTGDELRSIITKRLPEAMGKP